MGGHTEDPLLRWSGQQNLGGFAVIGFFAISGYLITKSGMSNDILRYMWARVLRIFPAFWVVLLFSAFVVGPIIWWHEGRGLSHYFTGELGGPISYLKVNWQLTMHQWGINDIFSATPYGQVVHGESVFNGSLWTLRNEWFCYLVIGVMVLFAIGSGFRLAVPVVTAVLFGIQISRLSGASFPSIVPWLNDPDLVNLALIFMIGACIAVYADKILLNDRLGWLCVAVCAYTVFRGGFQVIGFPAFAYGIMWFAARAPERFKRVGSKNDYSYGLYLYGFLVEQVFAYFGWWKWGYFPYMLISVAATLVAAFVSWHLIEKPALRLKDWGPGRGVKFWVGRLAFRREAAARGTHSADAYAPPLTPSEETTQ